MSCGTRTCGTRTFDVLTFLMDQFKVKVGMFEGPLIISKV